MKNRRNLIMLLVMAILVVILCVIGTNIAFSNKNKEKNIKSNIASIKTNTIGEEVILEKEEEKEEPVEEKQEEVKESDSKDIQEEPNTETINNTGNKIVVIDPGHGGSGNSGMELQSPDSDILKIKDPGGCVGVNTGISEYKVAWEVSMKLKSLLERNGITVMLTKQDINESPGNIERAEVGNNNNASLEIRIHCDSASSSNAYGATTLVPGYIGYSKDVSDVSKGYGEIIQTSLVSKCNMYNRGVVTRDDLTGFNWSKVPVILVELGFLSNPNEEQLLISNEYQNKLAEGMAEGIIKCLES